MSDPDRLSVKAKERIQNDLGRWLESELMHQLKTMAANAESQGIDNQQSHLQPKMSARLLHPDLDGVLRKLAREFCDRMTLEVRSRASDLLSTLLQDQGNAEKVSNTQHDDGDEDGGVALVGSEKLRVDSSQAPDADDIGMIDVD